MIDFNKVFTEIMKENQLDTVVIFGHIHPDGDAAGCVMGLAHYIKANFPEYQVYPYLALDLDKGPKKFVVMDQVFMPFEKPEVEGKRYLAIACDTATKERVAGVELFENAVATISMDHHVSNTEYADVNDIQVSHACSENVYYSLDEECLKNAMKAPHPNACDYLYMGIIHDTDSFSRSKSSTLSAGAGLLQIGVDSKYVMLTRHNNTMESLYRRSIILEKAKSAQDGKVAYICIDRAFAEKYNITYEDVHPLSGMMRDCEEVKVGFTMFQQEDGSWRCSFRSNDFWISMNDLLQPYGGGGHRQAAGLIFKDREQKEVLEEILERLVEK